MDLHRLQEERSIALHGRIAERLRDDPEIVERALMRLARWERQRSIDPRYAAAWRAALRLPLEQLREALVDPGEPARALRQNSPFAGELSARERWRIRKEVADRLKGSR